MLEFIKIKWRNLLSTGNQFTEIQLNKNASTLIVGNNGAGKSTLLDAITYALFGKPFRKINKPQLHNSITKKGLLVELELRINGVPYLIRRGDRPGVFEVHQDGKLLNQNAKNTEYQEVLEKQIIKCNFKSFCQIVILGSATYQPFMALPTGNRREIIEDLLDLQVFTVMNKLLVQRVNDTNGAINENDLKKNLTNQKLKLIRKHLAEVQEDTDKQISEKLERIKSTEEQIEATQHLIEEHRDELRTLRAGISDEPKITQKVKQLDQLRIKINHKIENIRKEVGFFHDHDNCPTCKQDIDAEFKLNAILEKGNKISETELGLRQLNSEYDKTTTRLDEILNTNSKITDVNLELSALNTRITGYNEYVEQLNDELERLRGKSKEVDTSQIEELGRDLKQLDVSLRDLHELKQVYQMAGTLLKDGGIKSTYREAVYSSHQ
jgi:DNA repair exonuclease SbcCD ATPase subunit